MSLAVFDIGYVPQGWERGQALRIHQPSRNLRGVIMLHYDMETSCPDLTRETIHPDDIGRLEFNLEDRDRFEAWLQWWRQ